MGGVIGFTLRQEDGTEHRMSWWTNSLPNLIDNMQLVQKSPEHVQLILDKWKKVSALPMAERDYVYQYPYLAPAEYGLLVVDMLHNKILDRNYYHAFGKTSLPCLRETMRGIRPATVPWKDSPFFGFHAAGRIKKYELWDPDAEAHYDFDKDINAMSREEFGKWVAEISHRDVEPSPVQFGNFVLDMSPFEVVSFPETSQGFRDMRQSILDLGFVLTAEEETIWANRIAEEEASEAEDEGDSTDE